MLTESLSLQEIQSQGNEAFKAEEVAEDEAMRGSIQSSSLPTQEVQTVSAEVCRACCKCSCHQPAPPTAPPTMREVGVQKDRISCASNSRQSPPRSPSEPTLPPCLQLVAAGSKDRLCPGDESEVGQHRSVDTLQAAEGKTSDMEEVGANDAKEEAGSNEPKQEVGSNALKQEVGSNEPKQEVGSNEPKQEAGSNGPEQEIGNKESEQEKGCIEKRDSGECVGGRSSETESSEAVHDYVSESKSPTSTAPTPQLAPPPKECHPVLSGSSPPLPEASPSPIQEPCSSSTKEDDYATVADALVLAEGERVVVCQRPSFSVTSPCAALPSQFRVVGDDYCEVIFANTDDQTPFVEAAGQGGHEVKRVRTLPRQVRQDKEEVVKLKDRSFSLRGKPPYPKGRCPMDILPAPPPMVAREEPLMERNPNHEDTSEEVAIATEVPQQLCSPTGRHSATFHIVEEETPAIRSDQLSKSSVSSPTTPTEREGPTAMKEVVPGRPRVTTAYTMVSVQKKTRNRSMGEKEELDEAPTHFFVDAPLSSPSTHTPLTPSKGPKSPSSPSKSLPSHIPISKSLSSPVKSPPSHVTNRRVPKGDYEEVDFPKSGIHAAYEEVKPSRIPTPRRQNPSTTK